jgi:hypothetical protein
MRQSPCIFFLFFFILNCADVIEDIFTEFVSLDLHRHSIIATSNCQIGMHLLHLKSPATPSSPPSSTMRLVPLMVHRSTACPLQLNGKMLTIAREASRTMSLHVAHLIFGFSTFLVDLTEQRLTQGCLTEREHLISLFHQGNTTWWMPDLRLVVPLSSYIDECNIILLSGVGPTLLRISR